MLEPEQHRALTEIAQKERRSLSDLIREMLQAELEKRRQQELTQAAQALLADYQTDPELTAFTALDGEDFDAEG